MCGANAGVLFVADVAVGVRPADGLVLRRRFGLRGGIGRDVGLRRCIVVVIGCGLRAALRNAWKTASGRLSAPWNAARVSYYVTPREVREDVGLTPAELAERLGMDLDAYLDWETHRVVLRDEAAFRLRESERPARLLSLLVEVSRRST